MIGAVHWLRLLLQRGSFATRGEQTEAHLRSWSMQESRRTAAMIADSDAARAAREELIEEWGRM